MEKKVRVGELEYVVYPWLLPFIRYENLSVKLHPELESERVIAGAAMLLRAATIEGKFTLASTFPGFRLGFGLHFDRNSRIHRVTLGLL